MVLSNAFQCSSWHSVFPEPPPTFVARLCIVEKLGKSIDPYPGKDSDTLFFAAFAPALENEMNAMSSGLTPASSCVLTWSSMSVVLPVPGGPYTFCDVCPLNFLPSGRRVSKLCSLGFLSTDLVLDSDPASFMSTNQPSSCHDLPPAPVPALTVNSIL